jgi:hypothetical protein
MRPGPQSGGVGGPEWGVTIVAEPARWRPTMHHRQMAHPFRPGAIVAAGPAMVTGNRTAAHWSGRSHEVSIRMAASGEAG